MKYLLFLLFPSSFCLGMDQKYSVSSISADMKEGVYAVVRERNSLFTILDRGHTRFQYHYAITILNSRGKNNALLTLEYDKLRKIRLLTASAYDASGNLIKKIKTSEILDRSSISDFSLYEDSREKQVDLRQPNYPYTVEFDYEIEMDYLYAIPSFYLYTNDEVSEEKSRYELVFPANLKPRFRTFLIDQPIYERRKDGNERFLWTFEKIKPKKFEDWSASFQKVVPNIIAAPSEFEYDGYRRNMDTWSELGRWQLVLNKNRDVLPPETIKHIRSLVSSAKDDREKVKILYEYLQGKTRYVSIQRGIGGFQPFEASLVDKLSYGDCKALSNYMVALLKEVGIKGYYTQIYGGENDRPIPPDFTIDYFNHIIVAVPLQKDTVWLECTSQVTPFGYLGNFTGNRYGLMITDEGGALVKTPTYSTEENLQIRTAKVIVNEDGDAMATAKTIYAGLQIENDGLDHIVHKNPEDQKKWIQENLSIQNFDIRNFSIKLTKEEEPEISVGLSLQLNRLASLSGKRMFIMPNIMNRSAFIPEKVTERQTNIVRKIGFIDIDTIHFQLPETVYPEFLPSQQKISSRFGDYEIRFQLNEKGLLYIRKLQIHKGEFPSSSYEEFREFYRKINSADNTKLVLLAKT